jgi:SPP1 family phage portal protein
LDKDLILKAIEAKDTANVRLTKLSDYYQGQHDILFRTQADPSKPNNRIVANYCGLIADFFNSYLLGVPIKYDSKNDEFLRVIQDIFNYNDESESNVTIGENMNIYGYGVEILYIDQDKQIRFKSLDPRETIFIYAKDIEGELESAIRYFKITDNTYTVELYDSTAVTTYTMNKSFSELIKVSEQPHVFQSPPLVIYANNQLQQGSFEGILDLQDALNQLISDELNDFEQFVDAYLVLTGLQATSREDIVKMRENKAIILDAESKAEWLIKNVNHDHIRQLKEDITNRIYAISKTPKVEEFSTLGSGIAIRYKLLTTETRATGQERFFKKGLQRRMELITNVLRLRNPSIGDYRDIRPVFERNFIMNDKEEKQQALGELASGLMSAAEYRMRFFNETLEEAEAALPKMAELFRHVEY